MDFDTLCVVCGVISTGLFIGGFLIVSFEISLLEVGNFEAACRELVTRQWRDKHKELDTQAFTLVPDAFYPAYMVIRRSVL